MEFGDGTGMEADVFVLRRNWYVPLVGVVLVVAGLLATRVSTEAAIFGAVAVVLGVTLAPISLLRNSFPRRRAVRVRAAAETLTFEGLPPIATSDVTSIRRVDQKSPTTVLEIAVRGRRNVVVAMTATVAEELLAVVGERSSRHRLIVPFGRRFLFLELLLGLPYAALLIGSPHVGTNIIVVCMLVLAGVTPLAAFLAWVAGLVRGHVVVGTDGFTTRWLMRERFVPFTDVTKIEAKPQFGDRYCVDTVVSLRIGKQVRLRTPDEPTTHDDRGVESNALFTSATRALERARFRTRITDAKPLLARGQRSAKDWLAALDALVRMGGAGYRTVTVDPNALTAIVTDPEAGLEMRVAAATAIVRAETPELVPRIRVAAEATADPVVRARLLEIAGDTTDEGAVRVLERVARTTRS